MIAVLFLSSCSNDEVLVGEYGVPNSKLTVRTRAGNDGLGDETSKISYPVNVYVFNETGKCVSLTALDEGESEISIALVEGKYNVYAVAGADAVAYDLPTQETATAQSPVCSAFASSWQGTPRTWWDSPRYTAAAVFIAILSSPSQRVSVLTPSDSSSKLGCSMVCLLARLTLRLTRLKKSITDNSSSRSTFSTVKCCRLL